MSGVSGQVPFRKEDTRLGLGAQVVGDWQGNAFRTTQFSGQASYILH
ncbi:hypothetical protein [Spirosoma arcticum]